MQQRSFGYNLLMPLWFDPRRFSTRLLLVFLGLILLTTLGAGVPAYWLTRIQLEQQAWNQVNAGQQATHSLLLAEQSRLDNLANLLGERPTLQALVMAQDWDTLHPYLQAFQRQSDLDILLFCGRDHTLIVSHLPLTACPPHTGFTLLNGQPALLTAYPVITSGSLTPLGTTIIGLWLDEPFLRTLAASTGLAQTIILADGTRFASSLGDAAAPQIHLVSRGFILDIVGEQYYARTLPLDDNGLQLELALPVAPLVATERQALAVLVGSTSLIALIGLLLGGWLIRRLTAPLQQLTAAAERISQGDFVTPIPALNAPIEVTTLAAAFAKSHTTMRHTLDDLAQTRDWFDNLIQSIAEGVITFDTEGHITFMSQGAERITGWQAEQARGRAITDLFPVPSEQMAAFLDLILPPGEQRQIEFRTPDGQTLTLAVTGARLFPPQGETMQVALVLRDVTEEAAWRSLRAYFLANITHEFRTPLSTLNASIELLLDEADNFTPDEMRELLKPTYLSLLTLQTLIDNLLESSRVEAGQFSLRRRPTHLNQVVADATRIVQPLLERRQQTLTLVEPAHLAQLETLPRLLADEARLTQVLVNLLTNASKYSEQGTEIELHLSQTPDWLRLEVADRGLGIPAPERINLFRRFVRLDHPDGEQYGAGLGLYVVKHTIEAHGGRVGVDNRPGGGSLFWVELPLLEPDP
ncbi:MAG: PAS domain S-box protein [Anaerolineae bacterium]|nr:PAS domain S-box protein [Anaerolineae bacterium]